MLRASLAFSLGRDLMFAALFGAAALLVSLSAQLAMTKEELRERSLEGAARYVDQHLQIELGGTARLPSNRGGSWASCPHRQS